MTKRHSPALLLPIFLLAFSALASGQEKKPPKITYEDDVKPILRQKCFACHNPDRKSGDLDLTNYTNLMIGGGSGPVVEAGDSSSSYLYSLVSHQSEPYMPPDSPKLPDEMVETIRKWIDGGVLETKDSVAKIKKKKSISFALQDVPTERPEVAAMPPRLPLAPTIHTSTGTAVTALATSPWSPLAAVAGQEQVLLYNTKTLELEGVLPFPEGTPYVLKFSRNASLLLAGGGKGGASGKCIVWNVATGERIFEVGDELDAVLAADISSDQTLIALGGPQRVVRIFSTDTGQLVHELRKHTDWIYSVEFSPDSVLLATGDRNGGMFVWEGWTGREYLTLKGHEKCVTGVSWRIDSNVVASASEDGSIKLWEMNNGGQIKSWGAHGGGATSVEFSRDGRLFSVGRDRVPKLWDQNGKALKSFEAFPDLALCATFCDETNRAIAGGFTGEVRIWDANDGKRLGNLTPNPPTLNERLEAAKNLLTAKQAEHKPLTEAYSVAQAAADKAKADLGAAQQAAAEAKKGLDAASAKLAAAKAAVEKATQENAAAAEAVKNMAEGVPMLSEVSQKAEAVAAKFPGDKEVAGAINSLKAVAAARAAQYAANQKLAQEKAQALDAAQKAMAAAEQEVKKYDADYKAAQANVQKLTPLVKPAEEKAAAAKQAVDKKATELATAQAEVKRWTDEIAFAKQLEELLARRAEAAKALEEQQIAHAELAQASADAVAAMEKNNTDLKSYNDAVANGQKQVAAADAQVATAQKSVTDTEAAHAAASNAQTMLEGLLPLVSEAAEKVKVAAEKANNEKDLAAAAASLQGILQAKQQALEAAKKDVAAKLQAVEAAKQQLAAAQKQSADAKAALAAAQKQATDLATAAKELEAKVAAAKMAEEEALKKIETAEQGVDKIVEEIANLKGINNA